MRSRIVRAGIYAAEAAGILIAIFIALVAAVFWRVQSAPLNVTPATPAFRAVAAAAGFSGAVTDIGRATIEKLAEESGYRLELEDVALAAAGRDAAANLQFVRIEFFPSDLFKGRMGPRRVAIDGAELRIVRRSDRRLKLDFGRDKGDQNFFRTITGGPYFRDAFERAELSNLTTTFVDTNSGRSWRGAQGRALVERTAEGYRGEFSSEFAIGGARSSLAFNADYHYADDVIRSELKLQDAPVGDLIAVFFNENADLFTAPVSGVASVEFSGDGAVKTSAIRLSAGEGGVSFGGVKMEIAGFDTDAAFDPVSNRFAIRNFAWRGDETSGALAGDVTLELANEGEGVRRVAFDLKSQQPIALDCSEWFDDPFQVDRIDAAGAYDLDQHMIEIDALSAALAGLTIEGSASLSPRKGQSPGASAKLEVAGTVTPPDLLKIWPKKIVISAREFIAERVPRGKFSNIAFTANLEPGAVGEDGAIPNEALALTFRAEDATVFFAPEMSPLISIAGNGVLKGNSFSFRTDRGAVRNVRIASGEVDIPVLAPKGKPTFFRFEASGDASDILGILNEEPLFVLKETTFSPQQFSGPVTASVEIERPNLREAPPEAYKFKGLARFSNLAVDNAIGEAPLTKARGRLDLKTEGFTIDGAGELGEAPVTIRWKQRFSGGGDKTEVDVNGVASATTADYFGVPTRQVLQGSVPFTAHAIGGADAFRRLELTGDLTEAALFSEPLGWIKPAGRKGEAKAIVEFGEGEARSYDFRAEGDGLLISGVAKTAVDGSIESFSFPEIRLAGAADVSLAGGRGDDGVLAMTMRGAEINGAEFIRQLTSEGFGEGGAKIAMSLDASVNKLQLREGAVYTGARLKFVRDAERIEALTISATGASGKALMMELEPLAGEDGRQSVLARSDDIGEMLAGVFGVTSVRGGQGKLEFTLAPEDGARPKPGALDATGLRVVGAPVFAKIFAAGSLTGLVDLMNGDGIEFKKAMARFEISKDEIRIIEARATGPSVGITAQGEFDLTGDRLISLKGAVAPAYGVNSLLGKTPVIGDIFVNRKGEGLLALSYDVAGPAIEPRVSVNPLSAFTPGVFRRMFEGGANDDAAEDAEKTEPAR